MAAKRSPILGYNHNVRYRGLIFHVQTEDSGLLSPHLFTHLFHGGVILSSRKLVYDAGSAEDAIKGLMQAQHKVVLKDLKSGKFDDKIDEYLGDTEGLLPREGGKGETSIPAGAEVPRASEPALQVKLSEPEISILRPETEPDLSAELAAEAPPPPVVARTSTPPPIPARSPRASTPHPVAAAPSPARTRTAERKSAPSKVRTALPPPPPPEDLDAPTLTDSAESIAAAVAAANATVRTQVPAMDATQEIPFQLDLDEEDLGLPARPRPGRDTQVESPTSDGIPGAIGASASSRVAPLPPPPERKTGERSAVGAASLPPARPIARPPSRQAISPPTVMSRPLTQDDGRTSHDSDAVEVYAPAPPSAEPPPGAVSERPGAYAQHKRPSARIPVDVVKSERDRTSTGSVPIPAGLARPGRASQQPSSVGVPQRVTREPSSSTPIAARAQTPPSGPTPGSGRARRPTPARVSGSPTASRTASTSGSGGVVMTRPAVIVGAPAKPAQPRVRKAREEEARGFGQGLISEKSLDEVILAYLSEDADDK